MASVLDKSFLARVSYVFRGTRSQDGPWSWVVCISAAVCNAINIGFGLSYGILFPELMSCFGETIERTGECTNLRGKNERPTIVLKRENSTQDLVTKNLVQTRSNSAVPRAGFNAHFKVVVFCQLLVHISI